MADMRKIRMVTAALNNGVLSSTYSYENRTYTLRNKDIMNVNLEIANAWITADSNVEMLPER